MINEEGGVTNLRTYNVHIVQSFPKGCMFYCRVMDGYLKLNINKGQHKVDINSTNTNKFSSDNYNN